MKLSDRVKFWLVVILIVSSSCLGGIFGNWIFAYVLDTYYGLPVANYSAEPVPVNPYRSQSAKDFARDNDAVAMAEQAEASLLGIFRRLPEADQPLYLPKDKLGQAVVLTADGWILTAAPLPANKQGNWNEYAVITSGKKIYSIDRVATDGPSQLTFIHLAKAGSLPVRDFRLSNELAIGQNIFGLEWQGMVEQGIVSHPAAAVRSSDASLTELSVSGLSGRSLFLFDLQGRLAGLTRGSSVLGMDSVKNLMDKLLEKNAISHAAIGVNYINLVSLATSTGDGFLLTPNGKEAAVTAGGAAARAGLQAGDVITAFDNAAVSQDSDLARYVSSREPGESINVEFVRQGQKKKATLILDTLSVK